MAGFYWRLVHKRALRDARHALGLETRQRVVTKISVALVGIILVGYFAGADNAKSKIIIGLASTGAVSLVFVAAYIWNFLVSPPKLHKELSDERDLLKNQFQTKSRIQQAIDDLAEEVNWATQNLVNPNPHPLRSGNISKQIKSWSDQCEQWYEKISNKLSNREVFTRPQQLHFDVLTKVEQVASMGVMELDIPTIFLTPK